MFGSSDECSLFWTLFVSRCNVNCNDRTYFVLPSAQHTHIFHVFSTRASRTANETNASGNITTHQWQCQSYGIARAQTPSKKDTTKTTRKRISSVASDINSSGGTVSSSSSDGSEFIDFVGESRHCYCFSVWSMVVAYMLHVCCLFSYSLIFPSIFIAAAGASVFVFAVIVAVFVVVVVGAACCCCFAVVLESLFWFLRKSRKDAIGAICNRSMPNILQCMGVRLLHPSSATTTESHPLRPRNNAAKKDEHTWTWSPHTMWCARLCVGGKILWWNCRAQRYRWPSHESENRNAVVQVLRVKTDRQTQPIRLSSSCAIAS